LNAISEFDLELLEDYLDDALSPIQVEHVARRLGDEPELALAMHELRAARVLRAAAWRTLEPGEAEAADVTNRVTQVVRRAERAHRLWRGIWVGGGIAAAVGVFVAGWLIHGSGDLSIPRSQARDVQPAPTSVAVRQPAAAAFHVALLDSQGNVIPVQKFTKADDARQFAQDLINFEDRRQEAQQGSAMLVSDRF
jgi:anti-sigma factor RsiW